LIVIVYFVVLSAALFAVGISGVLASRHFLIMMLSIEVALTASTLLAISLYFYSSGGSIVMLLLAIWAVASAEVIAMVAVYKYMIKEEVSLDVTRLSELKN